MMARQPNHHARMEILFELRRAGKNGVRVAAIDPVSGTEVTMVGDIRYGEEFLKRMATRKLLYVLNKKQTDKSIP